MTRHIAGLILFTFIVGTSAIIASFFYDTPIKVKRIVIKKKHKVYKKRYCRKYQKLPKKIVTAKITQAVFLKKINSLIASVDTGKYDGSIDLHFFARDEYGTRFLKTETINNLDYPRGKMHRLQLDWMGRLDSSFNLYVIAETKTLKNDWSASPKFDETKATAITIRH